MVIGSGFEVHGQNRKRERLKARKGKLFEVRGSKSEILSLGSAPPL